MPEPFFYAKKVGSEIQTRGLPSCRLGHMLSRPGQNKVDGIFVEWSWDGSRLQVRNDRYGFYPLFYFCRDSEICVSPSLRCLLEQGVPTEFDEPGLAVFLRLGFFVGEDTPFKLIRALPPDASFEWSEGELKLSAGEPFFGQEEVRISRDEAIDAYIALFRQSIRRRLPVDENFAVPLSGGRDSRHILLELCESGHRPKFVVTHRNYPPRSNEDARIAGLIAKALDLPHVLLDQKESWFKVECRKNEATHFCSDEYGHYLVVADYVRDRISSIYDGIAGDALSESMFATDEFRHLFSSENLNSIAIHLMDHAPSVAGFSESGLKLVLLPEVYVRLNRSLAIDRLGSEIRRHLSTLNPVDSFFFWNRTRREIALYPYAVLRVPNVYSPYVDHDLFDFLTCLPLSMTASRTFHTEAISRAYPRYSHIPFEERKAAGADDLDLCAGIARELAWYLLPTKPSRLMRNFNLRARLIRCLVSRRHSQSARWSFFPLALYLHQLESACSNSG